ncbi:hypothetical protein ATPR_0248 [Acetobacter tropicalis NBRC 101654]|uniref:Uncharacterized protein n=1 Tax=Acetobacter tropicalis NBRC 101654 TaxID=749388 RepID=F7VA49_9PROT|nr:hypothetical protein ATPR_0248 [Acetobacter tropicalis NBRC 101654]
MLTGRSMPEHGDASGSPWPGTTGTGRLSAFFMQDDSFLKQA